MGENDGGRKKERRTERMLGELYTKGKVCIRELLNKASISTLAQA